MSEDVFYGISFSFEYFTSRFQVHAIIYLAVIIVCEVGYYQLMFHIMVGTNKQLLFLIQSGNYIFPIYVNASVEFIL